MADGNSKRSHLYFAKVPKGPNKWRYFYNRDEYQSFLSGSRDKKPQQHQGGNSSHKPTIQAVKFGRDTLLKDRSETPKVIDRHPITLPKTAKKYHLGHDRITDVVSKRTESYKSQRDKVLTKQESNKKLTPVQKSLTQGKENYLNDKYEYRSYMSNKERGEMDRKRTNARNAVSAAVNFKNGVSANLADRAANRTSAEDKIAKLKSTGERIQQQRIENYQDKIDKYQERIDSIKSKNKNKKVSELNQQQIINCQSKIDRLMDKIKDSFNR